MDGSDAGGHTRLYHSTLQNDCGINQLCRSELSNLVIRLLVTLFEIVVFVLFLLSVIHLMLESITFTASGFEIEHQILHVETKLAESFLYERQNPATPPRAFHDTVHQRNDFCPMFGGQLGDRRFQVDDVIR